MSVWAGFWSVDVALKMSVLTRWDWHWFYWAAAWQFPISTATFHHGLTGIRLSTWVQHITCVRYSTTIKFPISVQEHSNTISRWVTRIAVHFFLCRVHLSQRFFLGEAYFCLSLVHFIGDSSGLVGNVRDSVVMIRDSLLVVVCWNGV